MKLKFLIICSAFSVACLWNVDAGLRSAIRNAQKNSPAKPSTPPQTTVLDDVIFVGETTETEKAHIAEEEKKKKEEDERIKLEEEQKKQKEIEEEEAKRLAEEEQKKQIEEEIQQKEQSEKKKNDEKKAKMTSLSSSQRLTLEETSTIDNPFSEDGSGTSATGSTEDLSFSEERSLHEDETSPLLENGEFEDSTHIGSSVEQARLSSDGKDRFRDPEFAEKNPYKKELSLKEKEEEKEKRRKARKNITSENLTELSSKSSEKTNPIANKIKDLVFQRKVEKE